MQVQWQVEDGYVGKSRPQTTNVDDDELLECATEEEREALINEYIQNDFEQSISWSRVQEVYMEQLRWLIECDEFGNKRTPVLQTYVERYDQWEDVPIVEEKIKRRL